MNNLRTAAQQALEVLKMVKINGRAGLLPAEIEEIADAITALESALAQQDEGGGNLPPPLQAEPVTEDMKSAVRWAPSSAYWSQRLREFFGPDAREGIDALERRLAEAQQAEPETCTWHQDGDSDSGVYATSCGRYFNLEDGTPEDNKMQWCCYCSKKLAQELITEDDDE